jgi:hypothetical protein
MLFCLYLGGIAMKEGARRLAVIANISMTISLLALLFSFKASVILFAASWALYGTAWIIDGFSGSKGRTAS